MAPAQPLTWSEPVKLLNGLQDKHSGRFEFVEYSMINDHDGSVVRWGLWVRIRSPDPWQNAVFDFRLPYATTEKTHVIVPESDSTLWRTLTNSLVSLPTGVWENRWRMDLDSCTLRPPEIMSKLVPGNDCW